MRRGAGANVHYRCVSMKLRVSQCRWLPQSRARRFPCLRAGDGGWKMWNLVSGRSCCWCFRSVIASSLCCGETIGQSRRSGSLVRSEPFQCMGRSLFRKEAGITTNLPLIIGKQLKWFQKDFSACCSVKVCADSMSRFWVFLFWTGGELGWKAQKCDIWWWWVRVSMKLTML